MSYECDSNSPAIDLTETKLLIHSIISDTKHGAKFITIDLKDMCLHTTMENPKYKKVYY